MQMAVHSTTSLATMSEVQLQRADFGRKAFSKWAKRRATSPVDATTKPSNSPWNEPNAYSPLHRLSPDIRRSPIVFSTSAGPQPATLVPGAATGGNQRLLNGSTPDFDLNFFETTPRPNFGAIGDRPVRNQPPRVSSPENVTYEIAELSNGVATNATRPVTIIHTADGRTRITPRKAGSEIKDQAKTNSTSTTNARKSEAGASPDEEFDPEADTLPDMAEGMIAPRKDLSGATQSTERARNTRK